MTKNRQMILDMMNKLEKEAIQKMSDAMYEAYMKLPRQTRFKIVYETMVATANTLKEGKA